MYDFVDRIELCKGVSRVYRSLIDGLLLLFFFYLNLFKSFIMSFNPTIALFVHYIHLLTMRSAKSQNICCTNCKTRHTLLLYNYNSSKVCVQCSLVKCIFLEENFFLKKNFS